MDFKIQLVFLGAFLTLCLGEIVQESEITKENGDVIPVAKETSDDCNFRRYTSVYGDNLHVIVDDFSDGISIVILSENPDVCYVRTLTAEEKAKEGKCDNGTLRGQVVPSQEEKQFTIGEEIDFETLPIRVQELCKGRKAIELEDLSQDQPRDVPKEKRRCTPVIKEKTERICNYRCEGWFWGYNCGDRCYDYKSVESTC